MTPIKTWAACSLVFLGLGAAGCASSNVEPTSPNVRDITVDAEANPRINFDGYKTYAWYAAAGALRDPDGDWDLPGFDMGAEIRQLTNRELRARGWTEVASAPEVLVMFSLGVDMKAMNVVTDEDDGYETLERAPKGALAIILADPDTRRLMWIGSAEAKPGNYSMKVRKERLDYAITKMLAKSPI